MEVESHDAHKAAVLMWKFLSPILMVFGTVGNILAIVVLTRKKSRDSSTSLFLTSLAVSDILALNTGLLRQWITYTFDTDIRKLTATGCKIHFFIVYVVTQFSSWMLVCVTTERVLSTWLPYRRHFRCNRKVAAISIICVAVCLLLLNSHFLYGYGDKSLENGNRTELVKCVPLYTDYDVFVTYEWTWIDFCVFCLIPFVVLVCGNVAIAGKIISSAKRSRNRVAPTSHRNGRRKMSGLTAMLMVLSAVFIVCITPIVVYPIGEPHWKKSATNEHLALLFWWETTANLLMYVNHSVNFVLYFLSGSKFRREVKQVLCKAYNQPEATSARLPSTSRNVPEHKLNTVSAKVDVSCTKSPANKTPKVNANTCFANNGIATSS